MFKPMHIQVYNALREYGYDGDNAPCIRVPITNKYSLSISQRFLAEANNAEDYPATAVEVLMIKDGEPVYGVAGYEDVLRFGTPEQMIAEIKRVSRHFKFTEPLLL